MSAQGGQPTELRRATARAIRRGVVVDLVARGWVWFAAGAVAVVAVAGVAWWTRAQVGPLWVVLPPVAASVVLAAGWAAVRAKGPLEAADLLDTRLGLDGRLAAGVALASGPHGEDPGFVALALRDAASCGARADVRQAMPIIGARRFGACVLVLAAVSAAVWFVPPRAPIAPPGGEGPSRDAAASAIAGAVEAVEPSEHEGADDGMSADRATLDRLRDLEDELRAGAGSPTDAAAEAARLLDEAADQAEREAEAAERARRELAEAFDERENDQNALTRELSDRLREGDFEAAAKAARELLDRAPAMSDAERAQLADELERLADALDDQPDQPDETDQPPADDSTTQPETGDRPEPGTEPGDESAPKPEGGAEDGPDDTPGQPTSPERDTPRRLADALRDTADDVRQPKPDQSKPDQSKPDDASPGRDTRPDSKDADRPDGGDSQQPDRGKPDQSGSEQPDEGDRSKPNESGDNNTGDPSGDEPGDRPGQQPGEQPAQPDPSGAGARQDGATPTPGGQGEQTPQPTDQPGDQPGQQPGSGQQPSDQPGANPGAQPGADDQPGARPGPQPDQGAGQESGRESGQTPGTGSEQPGSGQGQGGEQGQGQGSGRLERELDDLARDGQRSERARERAERYRREADRLKRVASGQDGDNDTPGGGSGSDQPDSGVGTGAGREGVGPGRTDDATRPPTRSETVDARKPAGEDASDERLVGEWFGERDAEGGERSSPEVARRIREAARRADRAIEQRAVPRRYRDVVKRVFKRLEDETAQPAEPAEPAEPSQPAEPAQPADEGSGQG